MPHPDPAHDRCSDRDQARHANGTANRFLQRWLLTNSVVAGIFALIWLVLRSGTKPSRFVYPCQQTAITAASLAFGAPVVAAILSVRRRLGNSLRSPLGVTVAALGLAGTIGLWAFLALPGAYAGLPGPPRPAYPVERLDGERPAGWLPGGSSRVVIAHHPDAHDGSAGRDDVHLIDDAVRQMVDQAVRAFVGTATVTEAWEQIIPDPTKKVAIKINCQIPGIFTKAKVVMPIAEGLIARGVPPDNIIIYDRTQNGFSYAGFTRDPGGPGIRVGVLNSGDFGGYSGHAAQYTIAKLLIDESGGFDCDYLINVPVCKALDGWSGVTMSLKNHYGTCSPRHSDIHNEICLTNELPAIRDKTRLIVLDATYCEYKWYNGRNQQWVDVVNKVMVSDDPVAIDYQGWQIIEQLRSDHGLAPCSPYPYFIDYAAEFYSLGTNDPQQMDIIELELTDTPGDHDGDGDVDLDDYDQWSLCFTGCDGGSVAGTCVFADFDLDGDVDCDDWGQFVLAWTEPADPPEFLPCGPAARRPLAEPCGPGCGPDQCAEDLDCTGESRCAPPPTGWTGSGVCYVPKNRYLSVAGNCNPLPNTARRVSLQSGQVLGWVGAPYDEAGLMVANLVDTPVYADVDFAGEWPQALHITGCGIAAASTYGVQAISMGLDPGDEGSYSAALELETPSTWGDVVGTFADGAWTPPNGVANFVDISAVVQGFQGLPQAAPMPWLDLAPQVPNGSINFADISACVSGFQGQPYPFAAPENCP